MNFRNLGSWSLVLTLTLFVMPPASAAVGSKSTSKVCTDLKNQLFREQSIVNELIKRAKKDSRAFNNGTGNANTAANAMKTLLQSEISMMKISLNKSSCFTPTKVAAVRNRLTEISQLYKLFVSVDSNSSAMKTALKSIPNMETPNFAKSLYNK
jgi:hypothetical protein